MKRSIRWLLLCTLGTMAIAGCSPKQAKILMTEAGEAVAMGEEWTVQGATVSLNENDNGATVSIQAGEVMGITLGGNPTTGYTWETAQIDEAVLQSMGEAEYNAESDAIGAGGAFTFRFEAAAEGETELKLIYHRPFEKDKPPLETFTITVVVTP